MIPARTNAALMLGLAALALAIQFFVVPIDADVSWLITVSERILGGQRLYVDIFEVNPPASVWLYLPQVALAHALGVRPETLIVIATTAAALASTIIAARLCRSEAVAPTLMVLLLGFVTLILPGGLYAQREHYALLLMLPVAAVMARIAERKARAVSTLLLAGAAAGLVIVTKPHFLFAIVLPAIYAAIAGRAWRAVGIAAGAAAIVLAAYGAAILTAAAAYLDAIPMLAEIYGPMRDSSANLLLGSAVLVPATLAALAWVLRPGTLGRFQVILALAIAGFTIAVLIQGKGYWNHALPGIGLGLVMLGWSVFSPRQPSGRSRAGRLALAGVALAVLYATLSIQPPRGLVATLRAVAPPNPSLITLGTELSTGHPAVRLVDGQWAGSRASLFAAAGVRYRTASRTGNVPPELARHYREDIRTFARDVTRNRPIVILVEDKSSRWLTKEPEIAAVLRDYRPAARAGKIAIWLRRPG